MNVLAVFVCKDPKAVVIATSSAHAEMLLRETLAQRQIRVTPNWKPAFTETRVFDPGTLVVLFDPEKK